MKFLHYELKLEFRKTVVVTIDKAANVKLLDDKNLEYYKDGDPHKFYGGYTTKSPVKIAPPHAGIWHVVIDLGGVPGTVRASVRVI